MKAALEELQTSAKSVDEILQDYYVRDTDTFTIMDTYDMRRLTEMANENREFTGNDIYQSDVPRWAVEFAHALWVRGARLCSNVPDDELEVRVITSEFES